MSLDDFSTCVRPLTLPSGKVIEVVYFEKRMCPQGAAFTDTTETGVSTASSTDLAIDKLHVCPTCGCEFVQLAGWEEAGAMQHWRITLRCPNCWRDREKVFDLEAIEYFEEQLDRGAEALKRNLESFIEGLAEDRLLPEHF